MDTLRTRLVALVAEHLGQPVEQVQSARSLADLGVDSLELIDLIATVETAFDITIPDDRLERIDSIDQLVAAVDELALARA
ncbi:acyl carrier protein [Chitinimonas koreensis]|uniref:acyl carrier protein n=1 Tax=Chitinimonas koreensis TaxID=356302 RepID=UPI000425D432|nr:phosphopantetheine-binding protein [Chitinimonas koreensis]QNM97006.1 acyl carrier protein [Chitinimonas koreensis]